MCYDRLPLLWLGMKRNIWLKRRSCKLIYFDVFLNPPQKQPQKESVHVSPVPRSRPAAESRAKMTAASVAKERVSEGMIPTHSITSEIPPPPLPPPPIETRFLDCILHLCAETRLLCSLLLCKQSDNKLCSLKKKNHTYLASQSSHGLWVWVCLNGVPSSGSHKVVVKGQPELQSYLRLDWGRVCFQSYVDAANI